MKTDLSWCSYYSHIFSHLCCTDLASGSTIVDWQSSLLLLPSPPVFLSASPSDILLMDTSVTSLFSSFCVSTVHRFLELPFDDTSSGWVPVSVVGHVSMSLELIVCFTSEVILYLKTVSPQYNNQLGRTAYIVITCQFALQCKSKACDVYKYKRWYWLMARNAIENVA